MVQIPSGIHEKLPSPRLELRAVAVAKPTRRVVGQIAASQGFEENGFLELLLREIARTPDANRSIGESRRCR